MSCCQMFLQNIHISHSKYSIFSQDYPIIKCNIQISQKYLFLAAENKYKYTICTVYPIIYQLSYIALVL